MNTTQIANLIISKIKTPSNINFMNKIHRVKLWELINKYNPDTISKNTTNQQIYDIIRTSIKMVNGDSNKGIKNINSKLTDDVVIAIFKSKKSNTELSKMYNISSSTISAIRHKKSWTHLTKDIT